MNLRLTGIGFLSNDDLSDGLASEHVNPPDDDDQTKGRF